MTPPATIRPGWLHRHRSRLSLLTVALLSALLAGWTTWEHAGRQGADFGYAVRAAAWLVQGDDPYERMDPNAEIGYGGPLLYPLPAAVLAVPFLPFGLRDAATLFIAVSAFWLSIACIRAFGPWGLAVLLSPPVLWSAITAQWAPLMLAAALTPRTAWLGVVKPNLGIAMAAYRLKEWRLAGAVATALIVVSFVLVPRWPVEWLGHVRRQHTAHLPAVLWPGGAIGLLGLLRWRTSQGRALCALTLVPLSAMPYDWVLLWLVCRTGLECGLLTASAWATWIVLLASAPHDLTHSWTMAHLILSIGWLGPATWMVLRRPNRADA